jgi:thiol-disulfide isomerase/thioredoxin
MRPGFSATILAAACALGCSLGCSGAPAKQPAGPGDQGQGQGQISGPDAVAGLDGDDIELGTVDGATTRLGEHRARVTIVAMWASFCAPCLRELHLIEALHQAYRDQADVTVLLVSIDDFDDSERAKVARIVADRSLTVPAFLDPRRQLMERLAPRDASGQAHYTVPMLVVIDERFGVRRLQTIDHQMGEAPFVASVAPLVEAALRGEPPPPERPYEAPLGGGFTKRSITLTVPERLGEHQIIHYLDEFRDRLTAMYPDLHDHQLADLMKEIEAKLRVGGSFKIEIPPGHTGAH